jgi:hypothetical protein
MLGEKPDKRSRLAASLFKRQRQFPLRGISLAQPIQGIACGHARRLPEDLVGTGKDFQQKRPAWSIWPHCDGRRGSCVPAAARAKAGKLIGGCGCARGADANFR